MNEYDKERSWHPPVYVLLNLTTGRPIGFYGLTEADRLELEADLYLSKNPNLSRNDIGVSLDKWGYQVPRVNEVDEFM